VIAARPVGSLTGADSAGDGVAGYSVGQPTRPVVDRHPRKGAARHCRIEAARLRPSWVANQALCWPRSPVKSLFTLAQLDAGGDHLMGYPRTCY
jgi:hypothetical protein